MRHTAMLVVSLSTFLVSASASARSLLPDDGVAREPSGPVVATSSERRSPPSFGVHFGVAAAAGAVGAPLGIGLGFVLANLTILQIPALLLALLPMGFVAPTLSALAGWIFGNWNLTESDGRFGFWLGWAATSIIHIGVTIVAGFIGLTTAGIGGVIAYSLIDGALMGAAGVGTMRLFRKAPQPVAVIPSFIPAASATTVVPLSTIPF